jgi:hypothetical protein
MGLIGLLGPVTLVAAAISAQIARLYAEHRTAVARSHVARVAHRAQVARTPSPHSTASIS